MGVICKQCGKKMPTQNILDQHINKRHGGDNSPVGDVINPNVVVESKEEVTEEAKLVVEGFVDVVSADGRELEVSVGKDTWKGKTITVPTEMLEEVRRLLETGGFFLRG